MIGEPKYGKSFSGILHYAIEKEGAYLIGPVRGTPAELAEDFEVIRSKNPKIAEPVFHLFISIHPEEHLEDDQWEDVAKTVMNQLGYDRNLSVVVRHTDEPQQHIHIIASRIRSDNGKVVKNFREKIRTSWYLSELEPKYGLRRASLRHEAQRLGRKRLSRREWARLMRTGKPALKTLLQDRIDYAARDRPTVTGFLDRLAELGVGVKANIGGTHVSGITFEIAGSTCKGSTLGKAFSWHGLTKRLDYAPERDFAPLSGAKPCLAQDPDETPKDIKENLQRFVLKTSLEREVQQASRQNMKMVEPSVVLGLGALLERWNRVEGSGESTHEEDDTDWDEPDTKRKKNRDRNP